MDGNFPLLIREILENCYKLVLLFSEILRSIFNVLRVELILIILLNIVVIFFIFE
jgi:hypothetical protein